MRVVQCYVCLGIAHVWDGPEDVGPYEVETRCTRCGFWYAYDHATGRTVETIQGRTWEWDLEESDAALLLRMEAIDKAALACRDAWKDGKGPTPPGRGDE